MRMKKTAKTESKKNLAVSVIVCTLNRAESLRETLKSLLTQTLARDAYEIIVVDNGSKDHTRSVVAAIQKEGTVAVTYVVEEALGLSNARNRGVRTAAGRLIFFIDDDARADRALLATFVEVFSSRGRVAAAGGPVEFLNPIKRPSWFPRRFLSHLSIVNYGARPKFLMYPYYPFGTNMVFHRSVFKNTGLFDTSLGRKGMHSFHTGEETELFMRIQIGGGAIYYHPRARVYHNIRPERLHPDWIRRQTYHIGFACGMIERRLAGVLK